ncbi:helix-turn-helix transcriptional regulator [Campylobacter sp. LR264d]|uniref:helix-turn-helix domain-containing protein n=1 Tax=Campylobacter sp. LR264d TaxID=2593544 RepID=UPI00123C21E8|nr:helix-turn-helix transcriptional regulator [Campylobacter sp. LR264d]KAA6233540.1 helix-turn-helix transcriptional regulator [Campylobacter sp. LR264d]
MKSAKEIIKTTCNELGLTQKELAKTMGIAENTISQWARGVTSLPIWAMKMFELLIIQKRFNIMREFFNDKIKS